MKGFSGLVRFILSGGSAALVEYVAFVSLSGYLLLNLILSQSISFMAGFLISFTLNRVWVFDARGSSIKGQLVKYSVLAFINLILSNILIHLLVNTLGLNSLFAKFIVMGCVAFWNYIIFSKIIFKNNV